MSLSSGVPWRRAAKYPSGMPRTTANASAQIASSKVAGNPWRNISATGSPVCVDDPKLPCSSAPTYEKYWVCSGWSKP